MPERSEEKPSAIIRYGGGFILACMAFIIVGGIFVVVWPTPKTRPVTPVPTAAPTTVADTSRLPSAFALSTSDLHRRLNYYLQTEDPLMRLRNCSNTSLAGGGCRIGGTANSVLAIAEVVANAHGNVQSAVIIVRALKPGSGTDRHAALILVGVAITKAVGLSPGARSAFARVLHEARNTGSANVWVPHFLLQLWHETWHGYRETGYSVSPSD